MQKPSKTGAFRRIAWQLGVIAVVLIAWRIIYLAQQPEQIHIPESAWISGSYYLSNGEIFWSTTNTTRTVIGTRRPKSLYTSITTFHARAVKGGPERILDQSGPDMTIPTLMPTLRPQYNGVEFFFLGHPTPDRLGTLSPNYVWEFRPAKEKPRPGEKRTNFPHELPPSFRLFRCPRIGASAREVASVEADSNTQIVGDWVYWIKQRHDEQTSITWGNKMHTEIAGHSDLMATSLTTGETRKLARELSVSTHLAPGEQGVYWVEPRAYPDPTHDLYYSSATGTRTLVIPDFRGLGSVIVGVLYASPDLVAEYGGRLYWLQYERTPGSTEPAHATCIVSANQDGSDRKTILDLTSAKLGTHGLLRTYRGRLYFVFWRGALKDSPHDYFCRLHPERADPIEVLGSIGDPFTFDENYFYYKMPEKKQLFWATLMGDSLNTVIVPHLYRIPLPK